MDGIHCGIKYSHNIIHHSRWYLLHVSIHKGSFWVHKLKWRTPSISFWKGVPRETAVMYQELSRVFVCASSVGPENTSRTLPNFTAQNQVLSRYRYQFGPYSVSLIEGLSQNSLF